MDSGQLDSSQSLVACLNESVLVTIIPLLLGEMTRITQKFMNLNLQYVLIMQKYNVFSFAMQN